MGQQKLPNFKLNMDLIGYQRAEKNKGRNEGHGAISCDDEDEIWPRLRFVLLLSFHRRRCPKIALPCPPTQICLNCLDVFHEYLRNEIVYHRAYF